MNELKPRFNLTLTITILVSILFIVVIYFLKSQGGLENIIQNTLPLNLTADTKLRKFTNEESFKQYLALGSQSRGADLFAFGTGREAQLDSVAPVQYLATGLGEISNTICSQRFSQTNVRVKGIDEPDIVKFNGSKIYYSNG